MSEPTPLAPPLPRALLTLDDLRAANEQLVISMLRAQDLDARRRAAHGEVLSHIEEAVVETDERLVITAWNQGAVDTYGWTVQEVLHRPLSDVTRPERSNEPSVARDWSETHVRKDGSRVQVAGKTLPLHDEKGDIKGYVLVSHVIAARPLGVDAVGATREELERLKTEFLMTVTHELRTPLNPIIGFTRLLLDRTLGNVTPAQTQALDTVLASANHLLQLIDEILYVARLHAEQVTIEPTDVAVEDVVAETLEPLQERLEARGLDVVVEGKARTRTDRMRLRQVLSRIVDNAVQYTDRGRISIRIVEKDGHVAISVADSGIGIRREDLERIFGAFQQLSSSTDRLYDGIGLSLYTCRKVVELLGGTLEAESTPRVGTTFTLTLPRG